MTYHIETATWPEDEDALRLIRKHVFIVEQCVPEDDEWDGLDPVCRHVLARAEDGTPVGTGRLTPQHMLGRMAVLAPWRGQGIGAALLEHLVGLARALDWPEIRMHAQEHAVPFYQQRGFNIFGDAFDECGIRHRHMRMDLTPRSEMSASADSWRTQTRDELAAAMLELITATHHELAIRSRELDPGLLDEPDLVDAIKRVAIGSSRAQVRILVHDTDHAVHYGHALLDLAQRLPTSIELRRPLESGDRSYAGALLVNDAGDYLSRPVGNRYEGHGARGAHGHAVTLLKEFDAVWERSEPCSELRRLDI